MRRRRALIILALALLSGSLAGYSALRFLQQRPTRLITTETSNTGRPVVIAARDLPVGSVVREEDVRLVEWPSDAVPEGYAESFADVLGRGVITDVRLNEPLLTTKMADMAAGGGLPIVIQEGMRALSVRVDEVIGVAGFVLPQTRVDVLLTITPPGGGEPLTRVILQNISVLAAGQLIQRDPDGEPVVVTVVTVHVTPEEAEKLVLAATQGRIQMALRNTLDIQDVETPGARVANLVGGAAFRGRSVRVTSGQSGTAPSSSIIEMYRGGVRTLISY
jgi:pilus assembly protein CpaB